MTLIQIPVAAGFLRKGGRARVEDRTFNCKKPGDFLRIKPRLLLLKPPHSPVQKTPPTQEDHRAHFYEDYRKVADEYDKEFLKKHDEDLNTTLIFVCSARVLIDTY
jgi:hypothetical protein